jgi:hypothetical protein
MMSLWAFQHLSEENFDGFWGRNFVSADNGGIVSGHVLANAVTGGEEKLILVPVFSYHVPSEHTKGHR